MIRAFVQRYRRWRRYNRQLDALAARIRNNGPTVPPAYPAGFVVGSLAQPVNAFEGPAYFALLDDLMRRVVEV